MNIKTYDVSNIQKVYRQFHMKTASVVYSSDGGHTWQTPPMDTGKWYIYKWIFAFLITE